MIEDFSPFIKKMQKREKNKKKLLGRVMISSLSQFSMPKHRRSIFGESKANKQ